jgi:hypothetical protein
LPDPDHDQAAAEAIWYHALAITFSPAWMAENGDAIRQDWPRVPLPDTAELLTASAMLGREVADLLDPDTPVPGVTSGEVRLELRTIGVLAKVGGGNIAPEDLSMIAGWGVLQRASVVMPGQGRLTERDYAAAEIATGAHAELLGARTFDVFLNPDVFWRNVPLTVWNFTIGGYQVVKKWLSYRERSILGRPLAIEETRHVRDTARRLAAVTLMGPALAANYGRCRAEPYEWDASSE